jgi:hypothetical protein
MAMKMHTTLERTSKFNHGLYCVQSPDEAVNYLHTHLTLKNVFDA